MASNEVGQCGQVRPHAAMRLLRAAAFTVSLLSCSTPLASAVAAGEQGAASHALDASNVPKSRLRARGGPLSLMQNIEFAPPAPPKQSTKLAASQYFGKIFIGKPPQEFRVIFDSSSGSLVLPGSQCEDSACKAHRRFAPENSSSAVQIGWADDPTTPLANDDDRDTKSFSFLGSDVSGEFMRDKVCIGEGKQICSTVDMIALSEESDEPFGQLEFDGVLGLSLISPDASAFNFASAILEGKPVGERIFSLYLSPATADSHGGGELSFGGYREDRMLSELVWVPLSNNNSWRVLVDDIEVGGKSLGLCSHKACEASIDTGASLIMAPGNMLWAMLAKLNIDDACTRTSGPIAFTIQGQRMELDLADYVEHDNDGCRLLLQSISSAEKGPALVLGLPFLRKYMTVFDVGQKRMGFARAQHDPAPHSGDANSNALAIVQLVGTRP